jgi:hypothetical protein
MEDDQRHARIFGVLFIITFITSISALALFHPRLPESGLLPDASDGEHETATTSMTVITPQKSQV